MSSTERTVRSTVAGRARWAHWITIARDGLLQLLVAPRCAGCEQSIAAGANWCAGCLAGIAPRDGWFAAGGDAANGLRVYAAGPYHGPLSQAVGRYKYRGRSDLAPVLAATMQRARPQSFWAPERGARVVLVPVPLHPRRLAERGYNQAGLLARELAAVHMPVRWLLSRRIDTPAQAKLDGSERAGNVRDAFVAKLPSPVDKVVLIDDVATTGATLLSCARALRTAGVAEIEALVVALADREPCTS